MKWFAYASACAPFVICWPAYFERYGLIAGSAIAGPAGMVMCCWLSWLRTLLVAKL